MPDFDDILGKVGQAVRGFQNRIPATQKAMYQALLEEVQKLEVDKGKVKASVRNLTRLNGIKNKLLRLVLTPEYKEEVKEYLKAFNEITVLQNQYWKGIEADFKPPKLLRKLREITIDDTVNKLTEAGIGTNIGDKITDILRQNITGGGSYADLTEQLRQSVLTTPESAGSLDKYVKQITTDALNQYNGQYTQVVTNDLGYEWFKYDNTDIETTRPFCDAMTDIKYFHVTEIPALLRGDGLTYVDKKGERVQVKLYSKTGLPHGMIPGTDASNFFVRRGGYNCGHQIRPVNVSQVPEDIKSRVQATPAYVQWAAQQRVEKKPRPQEEVRKPRGEVPVDMRALLDSQVGEDNGFYADALMDFDPTFNTRVGSIYPMLKPHERMTVDKYTGSFYEPLNLYNRTLGGIEFHNPMKITAEKTAFFTAATNTLNNALTKLPKHVGKVTRGTRLYDEALERYIKYAKSGEVFEEPFFISTAADEKGAFKRNVKFYINSKTGADISQLGLSHEYEVLFRTGTRFRVVQYEKIAADPDSFQDEKYIFHMEEID
jgi:hypothetical protein